jgi:hypothetical protein
MSAPQGRWHTREDSGIRLDRDFVWWHDEERIEHPKIVETFNCGLVPTDDGRFMLRVGNDWCYVQVEDAAYRVTAVDVAEDGRVFLRLSDRTGELLDFGSLALDGAGVFTCLVKGGRAKARFSRDAQFALGTFAEEGEGGLVLNVHGAIRPVPRPPP